MSARDQFTTSKLFERTIAAVLRPLTRALIAQGVTAPALYKIVKRAYVDVALEELGDRATDSRVSVATGIHRRDVKALREADADDTAPLRRKVSTIASVIGRWISDPDFMSQDGTPQALPRNATDGQASFDDLVIRISRDIRPRTILDEMARQGIVSLDGDHIRLEPGAIFGSEDHDRNLHFFGQNIGDHMQAAVGNLLGDAPPAFERAAFFNFLKHNSVEEIEALAREVGMDALRKVAAKGNSAQDADMDDADATHRFRFGMFFYREDESTDEPAPKLTKDETQK